MAMVVAGILGAVVGAAGGGAVAYGEGKTTGTNNAQISLAQQLQASLAVSNPAIGQLPLSQFLGFAIQKLQSILPRMVDPEAQAALTVLIKFLQELQTKIPPV